MRNAEKILNGSLIAASLVMVGMIVYVNKTQRKIDREIAEARAKIDEDANEMLDILDKITQI